MGDLLADTIRTARAVHRKIDRAHDTITAALNALEDLPPEARIELACDLVDELEAQAKAARHVRAGTVIDLRLPGLLAGQPRAPYTWAAIARQARRDVSYTLVQQWSKQYGH